MPFTSVLEYDPVENWSIHGTARWTEYDPVENWSICSSERWPEYIPEFSTPFSLPSLVNLTKILQEVSKVSQISKRVNDFIDRNEGNIFNLSALYILKNTNLKSTRANKQFAHSTLKQRQLEALNASQADVLKVFHISKLTLVEELTGVISSYRNIYNLSIQWALHLAGSRGVDKLLVLYIIDETIALTK
jgi:hypothetical protein